MLFFWIALRLVLILVLWIAIIWHYWNEVFVVLLRPTNENEVETGTPSEHDGKNITSPLPISYNIAKNILMPKSKIAGLPEYLK